MNCDQLLDEILALLYQVKESKPDLELIYEFMKEFMANSKEGKEVIPEKYRPAIHEIAEYLSMGMSCEFNIKTLKVEPILEDNDLLDENEEEEEEENIPNVTDAIIISMLSSHESFDIMAHFVNSLPDTPVKRSLASALEHNKPFAHFNAIIHKSDEREDWFAFRQAELEQYVVKLLIYQDVLEIEGLKD